MNPIKLLVVIPALSFIQAQQLPSEMFYSSNGKILHTGGTAPNGLYKIDSVKNVYLNFSQANYWTQLTNNYDSETLLEASLTYDGVTYDSIGARFRGNTSYQQTGSSQKKSFKIEMDFLKDDQELLGYKNLKFNNGHEDPSFMREVLYGNMANIHIPIAKANFVHLYINNVSWGIYPNIQSVDKTFLKEWFLSNDGARFRATTDENGTTGGGPGGGGPGGGGPGGGGGPNWGDGTAALNDLGSDTTTYQDYYSLKSSDISNSWQKLVDACETLDNATNNNTLSTAAKLDIDKALWFLATENIFTDDDSYTMKGKMDYMAYYEPETDRLTPLEYDGNSTFQISEATSNNWSPFKNVTNQNYPLLNKLLNIPEWRQRYLAHYRTILEESFTATKITELVNKYDSLISDGVANDTKKLYTTNAYVNELPDLINFVTSRRNYLLSNSEVAEVAPTISSAPFYNNNMELYTEPLANEVTNIKATVSSTNGINSVYLYHASGIVGNFTKVQMYDDGLHNDDGANDGVYGAEIPGYSSGEMVRYYIEAIANNTALSASYLPKGAEHDIFVYQVSSQNTSSPNGVVINELMASNSNSAFDEQGEFEDWIELYNTNNHSVDLGGFYLSDDTSNLSNWQIPAGTAIAANGYLIIWCDNDLTDGTLHTNFKLSAGGEAAVLSTPSLSVVDQVTFSTQTEDMGYARVPNGVGPFMIQEATFNFSNDETTSISESSNTEATFKLYPNPTSSILTLEFKNQIPNDNLIIYSSVGKVILEITPNNKTQIEVEHLSKGVYIAKCGNYHSRFIVQ
ncbi:MAG: CotH kinase family protein [Flavobacteriales bacterium]|jgi:hypothetical protein|nr:CotH kinase family protein [Flavobacteriales bacterium]